MRNTKKEANILRIVIYVIMFTSNMLLMSHIEKRNEVNFLKPHLSNQKCVYR